jgi:hypothetical protein
LISIKVADATEVDAITFGYASRTRYRSAMNPIARAHITRPVSRRSVTGTTCRWITDARPAGGSPTRRLPPNYRRAACAMSWNNRAGSPPPITPFIG